MYRCILIVIEVKIKVVIMFSLHAGSGPPEEVDLDVAGRLPEDEREGGGVRDVA